MKKGAYATLALALLAGLPLTAQAKGWSLQECLSYAQEHNIQVQKSQITEQEGLIDLKKDKATLWPSLSFNTNQNVGYRPFQENTDIVIDSKVTHSSSKVTYQGSYGINANWTIWNGGVNEKNVKAQKMQNEINQLSTEQQQLQLQEQIAQLYVQIMYCKEAEKVNETLQETAQKQYDRAIQMQKQGQLSKADVAQMEAQLASAKYDVVNSQTQVANYKRQLKALLELDMNDDFDVDGNLPDDQRALEAIPACQDVYAVALENRPEIKSAQLGMQQADVKQQIAKRGWSPTLGLAASIGSNHQSGSSDNIGQQMKTNLNMSAGFTLSIPIWDGRGNKSAIEKAKLQKVSSQLDLQDKKNELSSTIEKYWLDATSNQQQFKAALVKVESQEASYDLLNQQFEHGLKNVVELLQGRDNLISAKQDKLQTKYSTLLNMELLKFYSGDSIDL